MQTAQELDIVFDAMRREGAPTTGRAGEARELPSVKELRMRPPRAPRSRREEEEDFESMWDVTLASW